MPGPLKYWLDLNDSGTWGEDPTGGQDIPVVRSTDVNLDGSWDLDDVALRSVPAAEVASKRLKVGDLVVVKSSGSAEHLGKTAIVGSEVEDLRACFANFVQRLRPSGRADPRFVWYVLNSERAAAEMEVLGNTTTGLRNLSGAIIGSVTFPGAPLHHQRTIADFLDNETARIDALITKKRRMIELLAEHRNTAIGRAVTTGLGGGRGAETGNAFAPEIAHGWRLMRLRHVVSEILDTSHKTAPVIEGGGYLVVRTANVKSSRLVLEGAHFTDRASWLEWTERGVPAPGDVIFTREAPAGEACLVPQGLPLCIGQRTVLLRPQRALMRGAWLLHSLYSGPAQRFIEVLSRSTTVAHINMADIPDIPIAVPPLTEQDALLEAIEAVSKRCGELTGRLTRQIALLQERRQALITAAVTGELEVPGVAA